MAKILIIDDEEVIRETLQEILEYEDYTSDTASNGEEGLQKLESGNFDVVLCDIKMPKMDGMEVLEKGSRLKPSTQFIMISGHGTIETAVEATKRGAFDFIEKPPDLNRLLVSIRNAMDKSNLVEETKVLKRKITKTREIIGKSAVMEKIQETISRVAPTEARVLVTGSNGTGKELVARWIHERSLRSQGPLIEVNCAAIPSELIESELFGHEKGSFTGATDRKMGKFEQADQGTLFLDEVGEMSLGVQAKFLRGLEGHAFERVGGRTPVQVDVRVVAATNRDLEHAVEEGRLRRDLYFRLHVVEIRVIPLRERQEDIPQLAHYFLQRYSEKTGRGVKGFTKGALEVLMQHEWTGNVRELQNTIERSLILCSGDYIRTKDINMSTLGNRSDSDDESTTRSSAYRQLSLELLEQEHILSTLRWTNWNKSKAASILGIERSTLDRKLKRYQVNKPNP